MTMILTKLQALLDKVRKRKAEPKASPAELRAHEISDALHTLGCINVIWRYQDKRPICVLAYFRGPLPWNFVDTVADAVKTYEIDISRDRVRVWL